VLAYNWLVRRNKVAMEHLRGYSADLHLVMVAGAAKKAKA
jgi:biopolymer transport protein ExbB